MLDFLFVSTGDAELSVGTAVLTIVTALLLGLVISFTYMKTYKKGIHSQSFVLTIIMIPAIISIIILLVGSNVARAFSLAGAFSIIRFRSAPGDPKDITYIFFAMAAGLACGVGLIGYAALFALILCGIMLLLHWINFGRVKKTRRILKITIPENLDYQGVFDDIFEKYTSGYELQKVRTIDLGTLYELVYLIDIPDDLNEKEFLDLIRCRNGNLNIVFSLAGEAIAC
ncbi:DUF4956 domain-containing protein [Acetivibrio sp. MSJd-27]|jgi:hypothetical protein|uniref:DUF4956 domain-containing protein n=1 Tax=Acetivibrio sp. MSJd-27 TaxID=2841523 RepID=UPI0015AF6238|nr:DUF4956 domain-containing protein [Acetivibrio sp. MSJd-27]MBU5451233.1 DUF4956 domain-containing protein [Acetivibrio sp. MSJd-27]